MITGASRADVAVLLLSARAAEFESGFAPAGQTREHATLARTLGVRRLVLAVNKMDCTLPAWSEERFAAIVATIMPFLTTSLGYPRSAISAVPISALSGEGVCSPPDAAIAPWAAASCLTAELDALPLPERVMPSADARLLLPVMSARAHPAGAVICGRIEAGCVRPGQQLSIVGLRQPVVVAAVSLQLLHRDEGVGGEVDVRDVQLPCAVAGETVELRLRNSEAAAQIAAGDVLYDSRADCAPTAVKKLLLRFTLLALPPGKRVFTAGYTGVLHSHSREVGFTVDRLISSTPLTGAKSKRVKKRLPAFATPPCVVVARVLLDDAAALAPFKLLPSLGRVALRDGDTSLGLGRVQNVPAS
eukprot:PLAT3062.1.p1 GENE.PLAT3062.1~~PLAT3062.1.p1  ORF type:complete len:360 (-),score=167.70 PLAT3062.1:78-1157(-)